MIYLEGGDNLANQYGKSYPADCRSNQARSYTGSCPDCTTRKCNANREHCLDRHKPDQVRSKRCGLSAREQATSGLPQIADISLRYVK
jgi:hypothetical protein